MFQFTLPRGERPRGHLSLLISESFNSRSREGSDLVEDITPLNMTVSIHAPARGATISTLGSPPSSTFQFTLPRGERLKYDDKLIEPYVSIHAPARGATLDHLSDEANRGVSIHAPARGATFSEASHLPRRAVSIHAPARGATIINNRLPFCVRVSIHAPARGATIEGRACAHPWAFQFTLPRGERLS